MKVAVYTIALNEESFVSPWVESARDADYLLIADTGSTDDTVAKARALGVHVIQISVKPWRFDDARNAALAALPADIDYCISLDMDEALQPGWRDALEQTTCTRPRYEYTWSWNPDGSPGLVYGGDKIHARHGYRWKHPVHEVLVTDRIEETVEWVDLKIHHHPDETKSRGQYLPLLAQSVAEDPWDDRNAHYYARELFLHGMLGPAAEQFKRHLNLPKAVWKPERAASMRYLAQCEPERAGQWLVQAAQEAPEMREGWVALAQWHHDTEGWFACYTAAKRALSITERPLAYLNEAWAWGAYPYDLAAISAFRLGMVQEAIEYGQTAVSLDPDNERLKNNLVFYQAA